MPIEIKEVKKETKKKKRKETIEQKIAFFNECNENL